ncbi:MAG TPA: hypothetical protein VGH90_07870, partial [Chthoniobacteraceae bacterium]
MPPIKNINPSPSDFSRHVSARGILITVLVIFGLWTILSCYTTIPADSEGVLLRFGKFTSIAKPGLAFKLPLGIDQMLIVPV